MNDYIITPEPLPPSIKRLTPAQFAKRLRKSTETIYGLISQGIIEERFIFHAGMRRILIDPAALASVREKRKRTRK